MDQAYLVMANLGNKIKPIAVFEWAILEDPVMGNKSQWIHDALTSIEWELSKDEGNKLLERSL